MPPIILASTSPRRRALLRATGLAFRSIESGVNESRIRRGQPAALVRALARAKAQAVAERFPGTLVIGGDTIVTCGTKTLGKPHLPHAAQQMLRDIQGRRVSVHTGVALICRAQNISLTRTLRTAVWIRKLTDRDIRDYVRTGEPLDKAGGFAIQGHGAVLIEKIQGDFTSVIGLPIPTVLALIRQAEKIIASAC